MNLRHHRHHSLCFWSCIRKYLTPLLLITTRCSYHSSGGFTCCRHCSCVPELPRGKDRGKSIPRCAGRCGVQVQALESQCARGKQIERQLWASGAQWPSCWWCVSSQVGGVLVTRAQFRGEASGKENNRASELPGGSRKETRASRLQRFGWLIPFIFPSSKMNKLFLN